MVAILIIATIIITVIFRILTITVVVYLYFVVRYWVLVGKIMNPKPEAGVHIATNGLWLCVLDSQLEPVEPP